MKLVLQVPDYQHLLKLDALIEHLCTLFPGTTITQEDSYAWRRQLIEQLARERYAAGKPFLSRSRMEAETDEVEAMYGPSKEIRILVDEEGHCLEGTVCVSNINLSIDSEFDVTRMRRLVDYLRTLNVGEVKVYDFQDEENQERLRTLLTLNEL